jgi:two-component system, chemotaxis family, sensor histidine kinase and response regulator WspE
VSAPDLSQVSMLDLFRMEAEGQAQVLGAGLLALERNPTAPDQLESCMRAAHSLKGAARIVDVAAGVRVAHAMEDCFVAAQQGHVKLSKPGIDALLSATDLLLRIASTPESKLGQWVDGAAADVDACVATLAGVVNGSASVPNQVSAPPPAETTSERPVDAPRIEVPPSTAPTEPAPGGPAPPAAVARTARDESDRADRVLRVTAESLNRLLGLAAESRVESRWVKSFSDSLMRLKRTQEACGTLLDDLRHALPSRLDDRAAIAMAELQRTTLECQQLLGERLVELDMFDRRSISLSHRMYDEALACRMRPFADGIQAYPRMVRDVAHALGKQVTLEIVGESTQVDRDILIKLDAPLGHLLRNAVDHGLETPDERLRAGKPADGTLRIEARHTAGTLQISVSDDGRGIDVEQIRQAVVARNLIHEDAARTLADGELLEFLFLPGFSMKKTVTDVSGRGVGLDVVQDMVKAVRGTVRVASTLGKGTRFLLQLPVTLSVVRTLLADIGGEPYAFPLASIQRTLKIDPDKVEVLEGRQYFHYDGRSISLVTAHQVLGTERPFERGDELTIIVLADHGAIYGLVVDGFLGERELVVQPLDPLLGKVKDVSAGALMEDGSPVLILDTDDLLRSIDRIAAAGRPNRIQHEVTVERESRRKRVLVVDDSLTVRELERKLLTNAGYEVEVAVDGMDGWNAVRGGHFDLVVSDIDMPRMDGIELVSLITRDPKLKSIPVMIVSYKDRDEDRRRGLDAGASYYLAKSSFHDETLLHAVVDLIGQAEA